MRIKDGFVLRQVADQGVVIATGEVSKEFFGMIKLNATAKEVWQGISEGLSEEQIAERLSGMYNNEFEQVMTDVKELVVKMKEAGFIVEE